MDKTIMFAVAGAGKTTHIVNSLSVEKRSLIVTYTNNNYSNLTRKILNKFDGIWPDNITLMTYFEFLYRFCYKPFLSDKIGAHGIVFVTDQTSKLRIPQTKRAYYMTSGGYIYSNRLAFLIEKAGAVEEVRNRIKTYFDEFIIDEVQDIAGRDFNFLKLLMEMDIDMLFVGDFFQHTYDTSRDGKVNQSLFDDRTVYENHFVQKGFHSDTKTLVKSWRCDKPICDFVTNNLGITILSHSVGKSNTYIGLVTDESEINDILNDSNIVKLHFRESYKYGVGRRNWGETKGEDHYQDVCVLLNKTTMEKYKKQQLQSLPPSTRNKLYVAITRAHRNCYLIKE